MGHASLTDQLLRHCSESVAVCRTTLAEGRRRLWSQSNAPPSSSGNPGGWILRCSPWKLLLALFLLHAVVQRAVNHRPLTCPHDHHHQAVVKDVRVVRMTTTQEEVLVGIHQTTVTSHEDHFHASADILYSAAEEESLDIISTTSDEHLVEERVKRATVGGPLYGFSLSRHANYHLVDEYSISHMSHGVLAALLVHALASAALRRNRRFLCAFLYKYGFVIAVTVEVAWELAENWPANVKCYDSKGALYCGDSLINSQADVLCMAVGYLLLQRIVRKLKQRQTWKRRSMLRRWMTSPICAALMIVLTLECVMLLLIRDCLLCSVLQFFIVKVGMVKPALLLRLEDARLPLWLSPHVLACP